MEFSADKAVSPSLSVTNENHVTPETKKSLTTLKFRMLLWTTIFTIMLID